MDIILASASPRRRELLTQMGLSFRVQVSDIDEHMDRSLPPDKLVEAISAEKARAVAEQAPSHSLIIAADTVVAWNGEILGKPDSEAQAAAMLSHLSGQTHQVYTGFTLRQGDRAETRSQRTLVTFRPLTQAEIAAYVATGEPMDKAGAYGIQGLGSLLVESIQGDYFNVMGLPVCLLGQTLQHFGIFPLTGQEN
ncbi:MAG: septum formation inhibitor Maf [Oscillospiraceae bacterium]|jgi:septum formation protein|nr:septum formation inhibitor Maf [Oscillospiraceae bacterium]